MTTPMRWACTEEEVKHVANFYKITEDKARDFLQRTGPEARKRNLWTFDAIKSLNIPSDGEFEKALALALQTKRSD